MTVPVRASPRGHAPPPVPVARVRGHPDGHRGHHRVRDGRNRHRSRPRREADQLVARGDDRRDLIDGEPTPVTIRRAHSDGYRQTVNREVVFLIKTNDKVTALSSTCTHLGLPGRLGRRRRGAEVSLSRRHVRPQRRRQVGSAARSPRDARHPDRERSGDGGALMPRLTGLIDWLDSRTGIKAGRAHLLDEPLPAGVNWWFVLGSILLFLLGLQLDQRHRPVDVLRGHAGLRLRQRPLPDRSRAVRRVRSRPAFLRRQLHRRSPRSRTWRASSCSAPTSSRAKSPG